MDIGPDQIKAIEHAAHSCGRLAAAVESAGGMASDFLLLRHVVRVHDGSPELATQLLLARSSEAHPADAERYDRELGRDGDSLMTAIERAGFHETLGAAARAALETIELESATHESSVLRAAIVAGTIVAPTPGSATAQRAATLAGALALMHGGTLPAPWVAPWQLDAAARSAAVQVDRSASWGEWVRAWCHLLAREATAAERALRTATAQLQDERARVGGQHRVGGTDTQVLGWLQSHVTFTIRNASDALGLTRPTVGTAIERLDALGFATELTGQRRDRLWVSSTLFGLTGAR